eukprot:2995272-Karenia_brevis.AAC.1
MLGRIEASLSQVGQLAPKLGESWNRVEASWAKMVRDGGQEGQDRPTEAKNGAKIAQTHRGRRRIWARWRRGGGPRKDKKN